MERELNALSLQRAAERANEEEEKRDLAAKIDQELRQKEEKMKLMKQQRKESQIVRRNNWDGHNIGTDFDQIRFNSDSKEVSGFYEVCECILIDDRIYPQSKILNISFQVQSSSFFTEFFTLSSFFSAFFLWFRYHLLN